MKVSEYYLPCLAVKLQTLAALYIVFDIFSAKVCSGAAYIMAEIHSFIQSSIHLMYKDWYLILIQSRMNNLSINDRFIVLSNKMS